VKSRHPMGRKTKIEKDGVEYEKREKKSVTHSALSPKKKRNRTKVKQGATKQGGIEGGAGGPLLESLQCPGIGKPARKPEMHSLLT